MAWSLTSLLAVVLAVAAYAKPLPRGHVLVYKALTPRDVLAQHRNFTVTYSVLNIGLAPAYDIKVRMRASAGVCDTYACSTPRVSRLR